MKVPPVFALLAGALSTATSGCSGSTATSEEHTGHTAEALAWTQTYWVGQPGGWAEPFDLGPMSDRTCFLSAVNGDLGLPGYVRVAIDNDRWKFWVWSSAAYAPIGAGAVCISSVGNRTYGRWATGQPAAPIGAVTPARRCFLSAVSGPGWGSNKFGPSYNWVAIETLNDQLYLDGNLPYGNAGSGAEAVCVDTTYGGGEGWVDGPYTQNLADNEGGGWACGLVSVEGFFDGYNYDGPTVTYDAAAMRWRLTSYDNQEGVATCVW